MLCTGPLSFSSLEPGCRVGWEGNKRRSPRNGRVPVAHCAILSAERDLCCGCRRGCCHAEVRNSKDRMWSATSSTFNFDHSRSDPVKQSGAQCIVRVPVSDVTEIGRMRRYRRTVGADSLRKRSDHGSLLCCWCRSSIGTIGTLTSRAMGHAQLLTSSCFATLRL